MCIAPLLDHTGRGVFVESTVVEISHTEEGQVREQTQMLDQSKIPARITFLLFKLLWVHYLLVLPCTSLALATSRNKANFVKRRQSGIKQKGSSKRTPRWEQEGDQLYQEIPVDKSITYDEARVKLRELEQVSFPAIRKPKPKQKEAEVRKKTAPPHMVWGTLPVGPILKRHLDEAGVTDPTPIQEASFSLISKGQNAVIASPTGTGKTLAYLVPLLATKNRGLGCQIMIVSPTVELAFQIQREVDRLWAPTEESKSSVHVVGSNAGKDESLLEMDIVESPILCGTPRRIRDLLQEVNSFPSPVARKISKAWKSNLKTIVLDEADRLLRTEGNARRRQAGKGRPSPTQAQALLTQLGYLSQYQLICASATVGRTLRRQLMELTNAPSIDKASTVITADTRATGKDVLKRRAALLPDTIKHSCVLLPESKDATLNMLSSTMTNLPPSTTIIFPGRLGVNQVREYLQKEMELENVLSINDINDHPAVSKTPATWRNSPVYVMEDKFARGLDIAGVEQLFLLSPPTSAAGYMHLAGRTGRNGQSGQAITMVHPTEVSRLAVIAERVGVSFAQMVVEEKETTEPEVLTSGTESVEKNPTESWSNLSNSQLTRKTVAELKVYVDDNGIVMPDNGEGKRILKADLVAAISEAENQAVE